jgi:hypothetical protein
VRATLPGADRELRRSQYEPARLEWQGQRHGRSRGGRRGGVIFTEAGLWRPEGGRELRFRNVFRWSAVGEALRLEHLRFGVARPVFLFDLAVVAEGRWRSVSPHLCSEDCYAADMHVHGDRITVEWSVTGPRKQELTAYTYTGLPVG